VKVYPVEEQFAGSASNTIINELLKELSEQMLFPHPLHLIFKIKILGVLDSPLLNHEVAGE
jgi:hypothetical protein